MKFPLPILLAAQLPLVLFSQELQFEHLTADDGLSQNSIFAITRDLDGFLWIGTLDGLNRYNGYSFQSLKHRASDSTSLSANNVWRIKTSSSGKLLVRYQASDLDIVDPRTFDVQHFSSIVRKESSELGSARGFCEDDEGTLHVSYLSSVVSYSPKQNSVRQFSLPKADRYADQIQEVLVGRGSELWVVALRRVFRVNTVSETFTSIPVKADVSEQRVFTWMCKDANGTLWLGGERLGICYVDAKRGAVQLVPAAKNYQQQLRKIAFRALYFDKKGNGWLGSDAGLFKLVVKYDAKKTPTILNVVPYLHDPMDPSSIGTNNVLSVYEDNESILWVGTANGLDKVIPPGKRFHVVRHNARDPHSLGEGDVWALLEDRLGRVWVGTHTGLYRREKGELSFRQVSQIRPIAISEDAAGRIWVGSRNGTYCWHSDGKPLQFIYDSVTTKTGGANFVYSLLPENDSTIWVGTSFGLVRYNPKSKQFRRFFADSASTRMDLSTVMALCKTSDGYLWLGTNGGGALRFNTKTEAYRRFVSNPADPRTLSNNVVSCIHETKDNAVWVATLGGGLDKMEISGESTRFIHFKEEQGLMTDLVYGILEDNRGNLWLSTGRSLTRFSPSRGTMRHYTKGDGMAINEFNQNAFHHGRSGKFYIGGNNGFVEFFPDSVRDNPFIPPMAITQFKIFDEERSARMQDSVINLSYDENFFSFEFSSLSFIAPTNNQYAYVLEGLDRDWVSAGNKRFARYTHLDPGEYVFRVKGTNNDGVWNVRGASVRILISPPWWATVWFKLFAAFGFAGSISGGAWYVSRRKLKERIAQLEHDRALMEERQRTREQIARDLHDEVASTLSSISLYSETVRHRPKKRLRDLEQAVEKLSSLSSQAKQSMEEVVWSLSPGHDTLKELVDRIGDLSAQWCENHSLECHLAFCVIPPGITIHEEVRKNVYLIFKEAMNNIIKYSGASSVELLSWFEDTTFFLTIRDDGEGIDQSSSKKKTIGGRGLKNMQARAESIGAIVQVESTKSKGTSVSVKLKIAQLRH